MGVQAVEKKKESSGNMSQETNNKDKWVKLTGPAAESLAEAFFGPAVVVLQDIAGGRGGAEHVTAEAEDTANSPLKKEGCIINKAGRKTVQTVSGEAEGGCAHVTGKDTTEEVKPVSVPPTRIVMAGTSGTRKHIKVLKSYRIVLLGNTRAGKSSLANTIFGEDVFKINHTNICGISQYQAESRSVHGRRLTVIDTPGFLDTDRPEEEMKCEIVSCVTECSPGPHVFLFVLQVETFTEQKQEIITKICQYFPEEVFKFAAVVFTHGDQLPEGMKIEEFVQQNKCLNDLVKKCSGRCHVVDNNYWKNNQQDDYRSNQFQVAELLNTIDKTVMENKGGCYTNKMLQAAKRETEEKGIETSVGNIPQGNTSSKATNNVSRNVWLKLTGPAAASLEEAFFAPNVIVFHETAEGKKDAATETEEKRENQKEEPVNEGDDTTEAEENGENEEEADEKEEDAKISDDEKEKKNEKGKAVKKSKQSKQEGAGGASGNFLSSLLGFFGGLGALLLGVGSALSAAFTAAFSAAAVGLGSMVAAAAAGAVAGVVAKIISALTAGLTLLAGLYIIARKIRAAWEWVKQIFKHYIGIILLMVVFFSLLFLSFYIHEPIAQTILFMFGVVIFLLLSVV